MLKPYEPNSATLHRKGVIPIRRKEFMSTVQEDRGLPYDITSPHVSPTQCDGSSVDWCDRKGLVIRLRNARPRNLGSIYFRDKSFFFPWIRDGIWRQQKSSWCGAFL